MQSNFKISWLVVMLDLLYLLENAFDRKRIFATLTLKKSTIIFSNDVIFRASVQIQVLLFLGRF